VCHIIRSRRMPEEDRRVQGILICTSSVTFGRPNVDRLASRLYESIWIHQNACHHFYKSGVNSLSRILRGVSLAAIFITIKLSFDFLMDRS